MATFKVSKVLSALPGTLVAGMVYLVRVGTGFDLYATDSTGTIAYKQNAQGVAYTSVKTAAYTAALGDANKCVPFNLSAPANFTIPANSSVAFNIGTEIADRQNGMAAVTFVAASGVTLRYPNGAATSGQGDRRMAVKYDTDIWDIL